MDMALGKCIGLVCRGAMNTPKTAFAIALVFIGTYLYGLLRCGGRLGAISLGKAWNLVELSAYANDMKFDNLMLVDIDHDGDLDIVTTEEGEGIFSAGEGVLWFENPLYSANQY